MTNGTAPEVDEDEAFELACALAFDVETLRKEHRFLFQATEDIRQRWTAAAQKERRITEITQRSAAAVAQRNELLREIHEFTRDHEVLKKDADRLRIAWRQEKQDHREMLERHQQDAETIQMASDWIKNVRPEFSFQRESIRVAGFRQRFPPDYEI